MAGDWKTIDQREESRSRAKKTKRHGYNTIAAGGVLGTVAVKHGVPRGADIEGQVKDVLTPHPMTRSMPRAMKPEAHARGLLLRARRSPHGAGVVAGGATAAAGLGIVGAGHAKQVYHQHKVNERRRMNATRRTTASKGLRSALHNKGLKVVENNAMYEQRKNLKRSIKLDNLPQTERLQAPRKDVGKRATGGSFARGPSMIVRGSGSSKVVRVGHASRFGNGATRGTRLQEFDGKVKQPKTKLARFAKSELVSKAPMWTPTPVISRQSPITPATQPGTGVDTGNGGISSAPGGQVQPGVLIPSSKAPMANVAGRAAGGQQSGSVKASGSVKPAVGQGAVGASAATRPVQGVGKSFDPEAARQRRLGRTEAGTALGGAAAVGAGTKHLIELKNGATKAKHSIPVSPRGAALIGGGAAAVVGSRRIARYAEGSNNRQYR